MTRGQVIAQVAQAPWLSSLGDAIETAAGVIHSLPRVSGWDYSLGSIDVYIGRSSRLGVADRLFSHRASKKHQYGTIIGRCDSDQVALYEDAATFVVKFLKECDALCCSNVRVGGGGRSTNAEESVIYLTWRYRTKERQLKKTTVSQLRELIVDIKKKLGDDVFGLHLRPAIAKLRQRTAHVEPIQWMKSYD